MRSSNPFSFGNHSFYLLLLAAGLITESLSEVFYAYIMMLNQNNASQMCLLNIVILLLIYPATTSLRIEHLITPLGIPRIQGLAYIF